MTNNAHTLPALPQTSTGARIGLLGGSFNPAHSGHLYISEAALKILNLDQVWWLVSPGNPLKDTSDLGSINQRLAAANEITAGKNIKVIDYEGPLKLAHTIDTLKSLKATTEDVSFVWLMGADCFAELHKWKSWQEIMEQAPIAIFPRTGFTDQALSGIAATKYAKFQHAKGELETLAVTHPPCWGYIEIEAEDISSTNLRQGEVL